MAAKENEKMTIEQVAEALGVSKTTVSRALSGKGRISEKTRAKVFAYMGHARTEPAPAAKRPKGAHQQHRYDCAAAFYYTGSAVFAQMYGRHLYHG